MHFLWIKVLIYYVKCDMIIIHISMMQMVSEPKRMTSNISLTLVIM